MSAWRQRRLAHIHDRSGLAPKADLVQGAYVANAPKIASPSYPTLDRNLASEVQVDIGGYRSHWSVVSARDVRSVSPLPGEEADASQEIAASSSTSDSQMPNIQRLRKTQHRCRSMSSSNPSPADLARRRSVVGRTKRGRATEHRVLAGDQNGTGS